MNAAIDQQCGISKQMIREKLRQKLKRYIKKRSSSSVYNGDLPEGNDGLGLYLLGVTGDQVLPLMFIMK
jgi:methylmalonyl-CoA mutase